MMQRSGRTWQCLATAGALAAAPGVALAAEGGGEVGNLGQALAALVIFLLLLVILGKYAWKPVVEALRRREQDMETRVERAKDSETKAEQLLQEYQHRVAQAEAEGEDIRNQARRDAEAERDTILKAARDQARATLDAAQRDIEHAEAEAIENLKATTAKMAAEIAGRVLDKELDDDGHRRMIDQAARQIAQQVGSRK
jgi:F-type H+-transporting ATPase subunit b